MKNIFIFHGAAGHPDENWLPWLKTELEKLDCNVIVPQFPTFEKQTLTNWSQVLQNHQEFINKDTILVGHSLGVAFALNIIEQQKIKAGFFVAGFVGLTGTIFDKSMATLAQRNFDWSTIKNNCTKFHIYQSDNDPYIKLRKAEELSKLLATDITIVKGAGHFNEASEYIRFDILLQDIKKLK